MTVIMIFIILLPILAILAIISRKHFSKYKGELKMSFKRNSLRPLKEKVSITLDADVVEVLREFSDKDQRSFSQYINRVLKKHIEQRNEEDKNGV